MRQKPVRTEADEQARLQFAKDYGRKPLSFWQQRVHAYLDNKAFQVYLSPKARAYAAKLRGAKGTFRKKGDGLAKGHVKPKKTLKENFGPKNIMIAAAISAGKVLMWHEVKGQWNAEAASKMYSEVLTPALQATFPGQRSFTILEDNDPSGYKSKAAVAAKAENRLKVLELPRRSPDLNPLDYGFWAEVNKRMRRQERAFPSGKHETREAFIARLKRTATRMSPEYLSKLVGSMKRRCSALEAVAGADFQE